MKRPAFSIIYILLLSLLGVLLMATNKSNGFLSTSVSTISGTVSNLNHELLEYVNIEKPTHDHSSVYYKRFFVSKFNLGDKAISASFSKPITIADGDQLTVSGYMKNDVFQVLAYSNQTQQASHHENWITLLSVWEKDRFALIARITRVKRAAAIDLLTIAFITLCF